MNELMIKDNTKIENVIYEIRGKQVIFDSDIAKLYNVETRIINQVVKRNKNRFPEEFCFQLLQEETKKVYSCSRSQIVTLNENKRGGNIKYLPYVFTEHGIIMLSGLLKSDIAVEVNKSIVIAFVSMRRYISSNIFEKRLSNVETKLIEHDNKFSLIMDSLNSTVNNHIFFEGQIYDAYSKILDIFNDSKKEIIIIDNYLDKNMLDIISKATVKVILITADKLDNIDLVKYRKQYDNLKIVINKSFHDRFIILDKKTVYHLGASLNSLGKKCFAISKIEDEDILNQLLNKIKMNL